jgi:hypothetical protein
LTAAVPPPRFDGGDYLGRCRAIAPLAGQRGADVVHDDVRAVARERQRFLAA